MKKSDYLWIGLVCSGWCVGDHFTPHGSKGGSGRLRARNVCSWSTFVILNVLVTRVADHSALAWNMAHPARMIHFVVQQAVLMALLEVCF